MKIEVQRRQYGVGQGCFHFQEIEISDSSDPSSDPVLYSFVYDCGGQAVGESVETDALQWCLKHAFPDKTSNLNAVYLSHFDEDHVNGLSMLVARADVARVYVPHLTDKQAVHLLAQMVANHSGAVADLSGVVSAVADVARGETSLFGVPLTRVRNGPGDDALATVEQGDTTGVSIAAPAQPLVSDRAPISVSANVRGRKMSLWEIIHWCYGVDDELSLSIATELALIADYATKFEPAFSVGASKADVANALRWLQDHRAVIKSAYLNCLLAFNAERVKNNKPEFPDDHNVASLCVYSGPSGDLSLDDYNATSAAVPCTCGCCRLFFTADRAMAWLATGDAMLRDESIFDEFKTHFTTGRLQRCGTVLVPHHGADASSSRNWHASLAQPRRNCVISAGARNIYKHPHANVMRDILRCGANLHLVTESSRLGFFEYLAGSF